MMNAFKWVFSGVASQEVEENNASRKEDVVDPKNPYVASARDSKYYWLLKWC